MEILTNAEEKLGIVSDRSAGNRIAFMSQGRPHYTHRVGKLAVRHLAEYCEKKRVMLGRTGFARAYRYRFRDPVVTPCVLMRGVSDGMIASDQLEKMVRGAGDSSG
jgi:hypothetical protein